MNFNQDKKNNFVKLWLVIGVVAGFALIVYFSIVYLNSQVLCDLECSQKNEVIYTIIALSLFGMFVGSLTYYFMLEKYEKKIGKIHRNLDATFKFLSGREKKIVRVIINSKGVISQNKLAQESRLSKVQVSRTLSLLESKDVVIRKKDGMTNQVSLRDDLRDIYV